ncbi:hypothetical protein LTR47_011366 [Exophiala xenobiotica]|nr:hypothetical protein LTR47_011366 [Exophiala xenobiotica]
MTDKKNILCHKHFTEPLRVELDRSLTTKGSITSTRGKYHPTSLRPWLDFPRVQQRYFDEAYELLCHGDDNLAFTPQIALEEEGRALCDRALTSEKELEYYDRSAVVEKVKQIIRHLLSIERASDLVNGCCELEFHNHLNPLSAVPDEDAIRPRASTVDQACIFRKGDSGRSLLMVREYKAANKLTSEYLRAGLRPMAVRDEVVLRTTIPTDHEEKLKYNADRLVSAAVTQTFDYMIDNGLEYSSIVTGEAEVYLWVPEDDPCTAYYYLTQPKLDVAHEDEYGFRYPFTAVGRLLASTLMALHSNVRGQQWRRAASERLHIWQEDFDDILHQIPPAERKESPEGSIYTSPGYPVDPRSPYVLRQPRQLLGNDDLHQDASFSSQSSSDGPSDVLLGLQNTPSRPPTTKRKRSSTGGASRRTSGGKASTAQDRPPEYCTMKCLLGITRRRALDHTCPNFVKHQEISESGMHELDAPSLTRLVQAQLEDDMDHNCDPLGITGSCGAIFRVTLASHGYTFVAKGTVPAQTSDDILSLAGLGGAWTPGR